VSRTQFLSRSPARPTHVAAPVKPTHTGSQQLTRPAPALRRPVPVLRLAVTLAAGQGSGLASAVLARVAAGGLLGTVVLALEDTTAIDDDGRDTLHGLGGRLARLGVRLRLAILSPQVRRLWLADSQAHPAGSLPVHPSIRCAVLACYAMLPGPGVVTGAIRTDLERPAELLSWLMPFTHWGWGVAPGWLVDWRGLTDGKGDKTHG